MKLKYILIIISLLNTPILPDKSPDKSYDEEIYTWSRTFAELLHLVDTKYYCAVSPQEGMLKAMNAFLCFDPHSRVLDPKTYTDIMNVTQGEICGIGVVLGPKKIPQDHMVLLDVIPEKPAAKAGLKPLDKLIAIDNISVAELSSEEIANKLKGKRNSIVTLMVIRNGEILTVPIKRDIIEVEDAWAYHVPEHKTYYIAIQNFTNNTARQLETILTKALKQKAQGLIIDVRDNGGGLLQAAVDSAGLFVARDSLVVSTKDRHQKVVEKFFTKREPVTLGSLPVFILVNNFTASAAEILAGVLKLYSTQKPGIFIFVIGTTTFGKGSVQEILLLSNNCAAKITTALYHLPDDTSIQGIGVEPDFIIDKKLCPSEDMNIFNKLYGSEQTLKNTLTNQTNREQKIVIPELAKKDWKTQRKERVAQDYQIQSALHLINLFSIGKSAHPELFTTRNQALVYLKKHYVTNDKVMLEELKL